MKSIRNCFLALLVTILWFNYATLLRASFEALSSSFHCDCVPIHDVCGCDWPC